MWPLCCVFHFRGVENQVTFAAPELGVLMPEEQSRRVPEGLEKTLYYLLERASMLVSEAVNARLSDLHLNNRQFSVLAILSKESASQQALAETIQVHANMMVQLIDHLEQYGYASRKRDPENRRAHIISITEKGRRHLDQARKAVEEVHLQCTSKMGTGDRNALTELLSRLCK